MRKLGTLCLAFTAYICIRPTWDSVVYCASTVNVRLWFAGVYVDRTTLGEINMAKSFGLIGREAHTADVCGIKPPTQTHSLALWTAFANKEGKE
jgi:hypothetical protein